MILPTNTTLLILSVLPRVCCLFAFLPSCLLPRSYPQEMHSSPTSLSAGVSLPRLFVSPSLAVLWALSSDRSLSKASASCFARPVLEASSACISEGPLAPERVRWPSPLTTSSHKPCTHQCILCRSISVRGAVALSRYHLGSSLLNGTSSEWRDSSTHSVVLRLLLSVEASRPTAGLCKWSRTRDRVVLPTDICCCLFFSPSHRASASEMPPFVRGVQRRCPSLVPYRHLAVFLLQCGMCS